MAIEPIRLSKLMTQRGICSRREADRYIEQGLVRVNGEIISQLGTRVAPDVKIELARAAQQQQAQLVTVMLNKPVGYVSTQPEPGYKPALQLITAANQFEDRGQRLKFRDGLSVVGRLDIESQGLLLFTQDGRLAKRIIGEQFVTEKEYLVRVTGGYLDEARLKLLRHGLSLDGEPLKPAQVEYINDDQLRFVLTEGKKRQLRRMCDLVNLRVVGLKRVRIGGLRLGNLPEGKWRFVQAEELVRMEMRGA